MGTRRNLAALAATTALFGGAVAMAPAASAASGGTAPACVSRTVYSQPDFQQVSLYNTCGKTMHVNVVVKSGPDMGCKALTNKHGLIHTINWGRYQKTVVC
ncbi:hypothetical protein GCM10018793_52540 [Streptomyces sulfonofaciens]|uniref:Uncharacterized protein n=1 Tax=Streptomyces sulfonofaciens TaxID=68272 RepID=A0A919L6J8_9ACTN|nr:hypothetical protein [Streptomyces sulfonofaciens]GHH85254.1 hypothetical protein GCM10018793_52540 [Streptomyces sulfonofaciens]